MCLQVYISTFLEVAVSHQSSKNVLFPYRIPENDTELYKEEIGQWAATEGLPLIFFLLIFFFK